jgi:hypothetical protein
VSPAGTVILSMVVAALVIALSGDDGGGLPGFLGRVGAGGIRPAPKRAQ